MGYNNTNFNLNILIQNKLENKSEISFKMLYFEHSQVIHNWNNNCFQIRYHYWYINLCNWSLNRHLPEDERSTRESRDSICGALWNGSKLSPIQQQKIWNIHNRPVEIKKTTNYIYLCFTMAALNNRAACSIALLSNYLYFPIEMANFSHTS